MGAYTLEKITEKPLYCFKYNEETGEIIRIEIPEYTLETHYFTGKKTYCFDKTKINKSYSHESIAEGKLDRYVSSKVYTFNGDIQNAKRIILDTLIQKRDKSALEYSLATSKIDTFVRANYEFDNEEVTV